MKSLFTVLAFLVVSQSAPGAISEQDNDGPFGEGREKIFYLILGVSRIDLDQEIGSNENEDGESSTFLPDDVDAIMKLVCEGGINGGGGGCWLSSNI